MAKQQPSGNPADDIPLTPEQRIGQAQALHRQGQAGRAAALCQQILQQQPGMVAARQLLAVILREQGQLPQADALLTNLLKQLPQSPELLYEMALLRYEQGQPAVTQKLLQQVVQLKPGHAFAHMVLGRLLDRQGEVGRARFHLQRAYELRPEDETICKDLGGVLRRLGHLDHAVHYYRVAWSLNHDYAEALLGWARLEEGRNNLERAAELVGFARRRATDGLLVDLTEGLVLRRQGKLDEALTLLAPEKVEKNNASLRSAWERERGNILDRMGRYDEAFAAYQEAARIGREEQGLVYQAEGNRILFDRLHDYFRRERINALPRAGKGKREEEGPIFVVGFPRSGTTMVEQILASHPNIVAGDEMHAVAQLAGETPQRLKSKSPYPECLDTLTGAQGERLVQGLRDGFTRMVQLHGVMEPGKGRYTDKTPLNETHLGLLHLLFPEAPLVHLIRHPLDVVLSSFFNDVRHGGHFASSLEDTARHYAMTMDMVQQYRDELDLNYLPLRYEDLVDEQEGNTRKLLEFVGEPWHEGCLEFHRNEREARTASYAQVKEKLYTRSRFRYKNYRAHLDSIIPILEPHIERLGYSVDDD